MPIDPSTAFVSYSREDMEFAVRLAKDLKAKGASVWMDKIDIRPGQRWEAEIETAVDGCSRMLVILSPAAIASSNVLAEASLALDEGKSVIPVLYRECRVPFRLRPFQYADFRSDYSVGLEELLATLGGGRAVSGPEAIALAAISEALGLDPAPPIVSSDVAAKERERQQEALKQQEQAEAAKLAAQAEADRIQREKAEAARLAAEAERRQREQTQASRLAAQAETKRKTNEEVARQADLERARVAAEQERQRPDYQNAQISAPASDTVSLKYSSWAKGGITLVALLVVGWLVYLASSGSRTTDRTSERGGWVLNVQPRNNDSTDFE